MQVDRRGMIREEAENNREMMLASAVQIYARKPYTGNTTHRSEGGREEHRGYCSYRFHCSTISLSGLGDPEIEQVIFLCNKAPDLISVNLFSVENTGIRKTAVSLCAWARCI
jgi:hypothetical protein